MIPALALIAGCTGVVVCLYVLIRTASFLSDKETPPAVGFLSAATVLASVVAIYLIVKTMVVLHEAGAP